VIKEWIVFISLMLQVGGGKNNMHDSLVIVGLMWNALHTNFSFPQAVGEDKENTFGRYSDICSNCYA